MFQMFLLTGMILKLKTSRVAVPLKMSVPQIYVIILSISVFNELHTHVYFKATLIYYSEHVTLAP